MENYAAHMPNHGGSCGMKDNNIMMLVLIGVLLFPNLLSTIMQNPIIPIVLLMMFM